jgi:hypothetical protein
VLGVCGVLLLTDYLSENPLCSLDHVAHVASSSARTLRRSLYVSPGARSASVNQPTPMPEILFDYMSPSCGGSYLRMGPRLYSIQFSNHRVRILVNL